KIEVIDHNAIGWHFVTRVSVVNTEVGIGTCKGPRNVVDVPAAALVVDHAAHGQVVGNEWNVDGGVEIGAWRTVRCGCVTCIHGCLSHIKLRLVRYVPHDAGLRARTE